MRNVLGASLLAFGLVTASAAGAADFPRRTPSVDYYAPPPVFSWTGPYVGLNIGASLGSFSQGSDQLFGRNPVGITGGLTAGYNFVVAPNLVIGAEGDINGSTLGSSASLPFFGFSGSAQAKALFSLRGRLGYTMNRAMFYVTGGFVVASLSGQISDYRALPPFWGSQSTWQPGYTLGGGLEYSLTDAVSAKVEYLYTSTGSGDYFSATRDYSRLGVDFSTVRAGVNYHF